MSITNPSTEKLTKRHQSLQKLNPLFNKIQFLQLNQEEFPTEDLYQLSIDADYSIHPVFLSKHLYQIYLKLAEKYWACYENIDSLQQPRRVENNKLSINDENDQTLELTNEQNHLNEHIQNIVEQSNQIQQILEQQDDEKITETFLQVKQVRLQQKVTKSYHQIQKFLLQFDHQNALQNQKISLKIHMLNSWTSVPSKLPNFVQKKAPQVSNRIDSATYLENLKLGKQVRKDSMSSLNTRSIILGKNQSTQTKQMKHMLKVQAKTNFVEEKQKQESKLDTLQKKSIQLNYLLNVITKDFFNDFFQDILKILRENVGSIQILCQKIIEKVKEEHNFIQIYVDLIKKLCKSSISQTHVESQKFNELQVHFVSVLQKSFTKLIDSAIEPSTSNFNEYKYQKQMVGMSQFIGKLIKQKVLSRKIFKVCFWQIVYRYVQKVKENPQQEIVNQCLIEAIVTISDSMGNTELLKLIQKEKENEHSKHMDEVIEINKFQQMIMALVNPNDEDHIKREEEYNNLIESIKVEEYPHILAGLMLIFVSKRMKLKFLVENWQQKIETIKNSSLQDITQMEHQPSRKQSVDMIVEEVEQDLIEYDKELKQFVKEIKHDPLINNLAKANQSNNKQLVKYENLIKKYIQSETSQSYSRKVLKLLIIEFLKQFADCKDHHIVLRRIDYFINFVDLLGMKGSSKMILDIICQDELETLMIIECDYPFLVEGLSHLLVHLIEKVPVKKEMILDEMKSNFDHNDEDMNEFYEKVHLHLNKITNEEKDENLED